MLTDTATHTQYAAVYDPDHEDVDLHLAAPGVTFRVSMAADLAGMLVQMLETAHDDVDVPDYDHDGNFNGESVALEVSRRREDTILKATRNYGATSWQGTFPLTPASVTELVQLLNNAIEEARSVNA